MWRKNTNPLWDTIKLHQNTVKWHETPMNTKYSLSHTRELNINQLLNIPQHACRLSSMINYHLSM